MCGFYGEVNNIRATRESIVLGLNEITYRGPDTTDIFIHNNVAIGFNRLSIIDLDDRASQPMASRDDQFVIVFNGEIYNYKEIKEDLIKTGSEFVTESDTEVVLEAFIKHGIDFLKLLNGMFSMAIYDKLRGKIFLARDRAGQKPLVYSISENGLKFASEIKSILHNNKTLRSISKQGLSHYLALGYVVAPYSIYNDIYKLKPGHYIEYDTTGSSSEIVQRQYWSVNFNNIDRVKNRDDYKEQLYSLLVNSIKLRLNADVPLALFLSGGLDSSMISALIVKNRLSEINAFTIDFDDSAMSEMDSVNSFLQKYPEINHKVIKIGVGEMLLNLKPLDLLDEPFSDSSIIPTYWISNAVKEAGYTVAVGGDGGDELLGGYYNNKPFGLYDMWYRRTTKDSRQSIYNTLKRTPFISKTSMLERIRLDLNETYWYVRSLTSIIINERVLKPTARKILSNEFLPRNGATSTASFSEFETNDFKYRLPDGFLTKVDKASMYNSMEVRSPFLDHRIIELLMGMPKEYKINNAKTKVLLREIAKDYNLLNSQILEQRKMGFSIPLRQWVTGEMRKLIIETVYSSALSNYINKHEFQKLFEKGENGVMHNAHVECIWRLFVLAKVMTKYDINSLI
jgi:asparagine synthase (glutamine-hydrolysing)